jgi:hypothetical protein
LTTELEGRFSRPKMKTGYNLPVALDKVTSFRNRSLAIGLVHKFKQESSTMNYRLNRMLKQVGLFKWIEPASSDIEATEYARFHASDTLVDIIPNVPFCLSNPLVRETDVNIDSYIANNCQKAKPRIYLGHSALCLLKADSYIAELPYLSSKNKRNMFLTPEGRMEFPEAVRANTDCNGSEKLSYAIDVDDCLIIRSYVEDSNFFPLAYIEHPLKDENGRRQKHIVAFYYKDTNSIGILYNPERTDYTDSNREFQNTGLKYGCVFFMSVLTDMLERAQSDNAALLHKKETKRFL